MSDRNLNIRVALNAVNNFSSPVRAAQRSAAGFSSQIKATQNSIKNLAGQAATFDRLSQSVKRNNTAYEESKAKVKALRDSYPALNQRTEEQKRVLEQARQARDRLGRSLDSEKQKLQTAAAQLYRHGISVRNSDNATAQITRRTEAYNRQLEAQRQQLAAVTRAQSQYQKAKETRGKLAMGGAAAMAAGGGMLYGMSKIIAPGREFDFRMSNVQALTKLDKDSPQFQALRDQAKELGANTAFTAADAASGQKFLAMAGFTPDAIKQALPGVLNMALAGAMADNGIRGSMAGTSLRAGLSRLVAPVGKGQKAMEALGVSIKDANGQLRSADEILKDVGIRLRKYDQASQIKLKKDIFGEEAMVGMGAVIDATLNGKYDKLKKLNDEARGRAKAIADTNMDNLDGDILGLTSAWQGFGIELKEKIDPILRSITQTITGVIRSITAWMNAHPQLTKALGVAVIAIGAITAAIGALALVAAAVIVPIAALRLGLFMLGSGGIGALIPQMGFLSTMLSGLMPKLRAIGTGIGSWSGIFTSIGGSIVNFGRNAFGLIISNAIRAGAAMKFAFTNPMASLAILGNGVKNLALSGFSGLANAARMTFSAVGGGLSMLLSPVSILVIAIVGAAIAIYKYWDHIRAFFGGFFEGLMTGLAPIGQAFSAVFGGLAPVFDGIWTAIKKMWDWLTELFTPIKASDEALQACTEAGKIFGEVVGIAIRTLLYPIELVAKGIGSILELLGMAPTAAEDAVNKINKMKPVELSAADAAKLKGQGEKVMSLFTPKWKLPKGASDFIDGAGKKVSDVAGKAKEKLTGAWDEAIKEAEKKNKQKEATDAAYGSQVYDPTAKKDKDGSGFSSPADNAAKDPNKLGEIVFKNFPAIKAVDGLYQDPSVRSPSAFKRVSAPDVIASDITPAKMEMQRPAARQDIKQEGDKIELHFHGVDMANAKSIAALVRQELEKLKRTQDSRLRSQLTDIG
ncbi:phage tail tape measure protein [Morganella morganii]|uniref:Phage tail tape measure protein n=1 Tax=Morganella morganii TaxID=582 RepID=A0A433ZYJ9_MORMO|nr:phage tail tape measure protein [Morganella morganii]RUT67196.1 phage tail tape measure protein [Morganella morganii]